ncbi:hypothetical protein [Aeromonas salmonicida]|uniref:hypothetical protein n=1 Tax=Aeromonas salmonicida TaxID=645 RepID=UPI00366C1B51
MFSRIFWYRINHISANISVVSNLCWQRSEFFCKQEIQGLVHFALLIRLTGKAVEPGRFEVSYAVDTGKLDHAHSCTSP